MMRRILSLLRRSEAARLTAAVIIAAAGAVAVVEALTAGSGHRHTGGSAIASGTPAGGSPGGSSPAAGGGSKGGSAQNSTGSAAASSQAANAVASSPGVSSALRKGSMTIVMDQPPGGLFAEQNRSIARGTAVAVDELNAGGGLPRHVHLKLLLQTLDGLSASALHQRLLSDRAAALVLPCDTDSQFTLASSVARFGILMLAPCNAEPQAGHDFPTYWPVGSAASDETLELANFMRLVGYGNVFVVDSPGSRYVELLTSYFRNAAQVKHIQLVGGASIAMSTRDFSSLAHEIQAANPKPSAIFTALPPPVVNKLAAGLAAQGVSQTVFGTAVMDTPLTLSGRGESLNNSVFSSLGFPRVSAAARRFAADYRRLFHSDPVGGFPEVGLETIRLLEDAARKARSADPRAIQRVLVGGITLQGVGLADRSYQAGGDHNPVAEVSVAKIASGSFLPLYAGMPGGHA